MAITQTEPGESLKIWHGFSHYSNMNFVMGLYQQGVQLAFEYFEQEYEIECEVDYYDDADMDNDWYDPSFLFA